MQCLNVGAKVSFNDKADRGVQTGVVAEILYIIKRDKPIPAFQVTYHIESPERKTEICSQNDTPLATSEHSITPRLIVEPMTGGRNKTRKVNRKFLRNTKKRI